MSRTEIAAAITVMLYTRPAIVAGETIRGLEVLTRPHTEGPYARATFDEQEAAERLESGFWVDHPNGLAKLDEAISEAAEKEAKREKQKADDEEDERLKEEQDKKEDVKPEEDHTPEARSDVDPEVDPAAEVEPKTESEVEPEPEPVVVDGAKVQTGKKVKK